jgi:uncharacterized membrane protein YqjE
MSQQALALWGILAASLVLIVLCVRTFRGRSLKISLEDFIALFLSSLGCISSFHLIYKAFSLKELQDILGGDVVTLIIGGIAVVWVSTKEIIRIMFED